MGWALVFGCVLFLLLFFWGGDVSFVLIGLGSVVWRFQGFPARCHTFFIARCDAFFITLLLCFSARFKISSLFHFRFTVVCAPLIHVLLTSLLAHSPFPFPLHSSISISISLAFEAPPFFPFGAPRPASTFDLVAVPF